MNWANNPLYNFPFFTHKAKIIKRYGGAVVVMAFDEEGQAADEQR